MYLLINYDILCDIICRDRVKYIFVFVFKYTDFVYLYLYLIVVFVVFDQIKFQIHF